MNYNGRVDIQKLRKERIDVDYYGIYIQRRVIDGGISNFKRVFQYFSISIIWVIFFFRGIIIEVLWYEIEQKKGKVEVVCVFFFQFGFF